MQNKLITTARSLTSFLKTYAERQRLDWQKREETDRFVAKINQVFIDLHVFHAEDRFDPRIGKQFRRTYYPRVRVLKWLDGDTAMAYVAIPPQLKLSHAEIAPTEFAYRLGVHRVDFLLNTVAEEPDLRFGIRIEFTGKRRAANADWDRKPDFAFLATKEADLANFPIGRDAESGKDIAMALPPSLIVAGLPNFGKTTFCQNLIIRLANKTNVDLAFVDGKRVELERYARLDNLFGGKIACDLLGALELLESLNAEMERRYGVLSQLNVRDFHASPLKPLVVFIDEVLNLLATAEDTQAQRFTDLLLALLSKSRAAGFYFVLSSQYLLNDLFKEKGGLVKALLAEKAIFRLNAVQSRTMLDGSDEASDLPVGRFVLRLNGKRSVIDGFNVTDDDLKKVLTAIPRDRIIDAHDLPAGVFIVRRIRSDADLAWKGIPFAKLLAFVKVHQPTLENLITELDVSNYRARQLQELLMPLYSEPHGREKLRDLIPADPATLRRELSTAIKNHQ